MYVYYVCMYIMYVYVYYVCMYICMYVYYVYECGLCVVILNEIGNTVAYKPVGCVSLTTAGPLNNHKHI